MPEPADRQLNRIVQLVADLTRADRDGTPAPTLEELSARYGVRPSVILQDLRILTEAGDDSNDTWLLSLVVTQDRDRVSVQSRGPYRRPIRLTPEELLVLQAALATEDGVGDATRAKLGVLSSAALAAADAVRAVPAGFGPEVAVVARAEQAMGACRALRLRYVGEGAEEPSERVVEVHDVVSGLGRHYLVAWCRVAGAWRRFRADRVLDAELLEEEFARRSDMPVIEGRADLFEAPPDGVEEVRVRFSPRIARWIAERYPQGERQADGSVVVTFKSASVGWLVRDVLQYGAEAEVLGPASHREAVRRAVMM
jgi:predicted DNA-binding transcriptional regulator YafY